MKIFFYTGRNPDNQSGLSWRLWKIERRGRKVHVWWGPVKILRRRITPTATLQTKSWTFPSEERAREEESARIQAQLRQGYERKPRH